MQEKGKLRRVFPGSNSARGFFSFFEHIVAPEKSRVWVIKGGPGNGKSTLMGKIGRALQAQGYDLEYHHCASDSTSLDGLVIPALQTALVDGTFPHVFDPPFPGAAGEIIDLGRFWNAAGLRKNKEQIIKLEAEISRRFKQAHRLLAIAGIYLEAAESYYRLPGVLDQGAFDNLTLKLTAEIFTAQAAEGGGRVRRLFASAIAPEGFVHHLATLLEPLSTVYLLQGEYSSGKSEIIRRITEAALWRGFYVEAFHCALHPEKIDHLLIPQLGIALVNNTVPHSITPAGNCREIDSRQFMAALPGRLQAEKNSLDQSCNEALAAALHFLAQAKAGYQELESLYRPHLRFAAVDRLGQEILAGILEQAADQGAT
ncbi:MAG: hypothetical protein GX334_05330 [Firmicutes bacterium]|nr:hypothetical protein [Bacillota bacterium]